MRKMPAHRFACHARSSSVSALLIASLVLIAACEDSSARSAPATSSPLMQPAAESPPPGRNAAVNPLNRIRYHCTDDMVVTVEYGGDSATLTLGNEPHLLLQEPSGSGVRYSNENVSWHAREQEALLSAGDEARICLQLAR